MNIANPFVTNFGRGRDRWCVSSRRIATKRNVPGLLDYFVTLALQVVANIVPYIISFFPFLCNLQQSVVNRDRLACLFKSAVENFFGRIFLRCQHFEMAFKQDKKIKRSAR